MVAWRWLVLLFLNAAASPNYSLIKHVVVIYQENWSFDALYSQFPGARGAPANGWVRQVDNHGNVINTMSGPPLPEPMNTTHYDLNAYVPPAGVTADIIHLFYHQQAQIGSGNGEGFLYWTDNKGLVLSYYDATDMPLGRIAQNFTMCDNMFHSAFGGSFLNHQWLIAARTPVFPGGCGGQRSVVDFTDASTLVDNVCTPDDYAVNTVFSLATPFPSFAPNPATRLPPQTHVTIGDRLTEAGVGWAWYSGGWDNYFAGTPDEYFQYHHQPFVYFANYSDGTKGRADHLKDETEFLAALASNTVKPVSFLKFTGIENQHPGYSALADGERHAADVIEAIRASPIWNSTVIILTFDENGGRFDHVTPPEIDMWGPGVRVPGIVISPFAKKKFVDHTQYETVSILALIERIWNLEPLTARDAAADPFTGCLDLGTAPPSPSVSRSASPRAMETGADGSKDLNPGGVATAIGLGVGLGLGVLCGVGVLIVVVFYVRKRMKRTMGAERLSEEVQRLRCYPSCSILLPRRSGKQVGCTQQQCGTWKWSLQTSHATLGQSGIRLQGEDQGEDVDMDLIDNRACNRTTSSGSQDAAPPPKKRGLSQFTISDSAQSAKSGISSELSLGPPAPARPASALKAGPAPTAPAAAAQAPIASESRPAPKLAPPPQPTQGFEISE